MPFKSQAQRGFMYVHHPEIAKEFEAATPKDKTLPYKVSGEKRSKKKRRRLKSKEERQEYMSKLL